MVNLSIVGTAKYDAKHSTSKDGREFTTLMVECEDLRSKYPLIVTVHLPGKTAVPAGAQVSYSGSCYTKVIEKNGKTYANLHLCVNNF